MSSWTRRLAGGLALAILALPSALRAASALTPRNRTPLLRVAHAQFHRGRLAKGGPVVYRNSGSGGSGEEPGGEKAAGDLPSVGVFVSLPPSYRLESLEVTATPRDEAGVLDVLVDREVHGDPIELTRGGPGTHTVDLTAVSGGGTRRIEVRVGASSGDVTVSGLTVTARKLDRGVARASEARVLPDARDAREFLPFDSETVWRYEDPDDDEERFDVAVVGVESYGGRDLLRVEDGGADTWQLVDVREGRWLVVHKREGEPLRDFDRRPLPWFPVDETIPGDRYEALFRRTVNDQPPELRWTVEVEEGERVSVAAGTYTSVLRLRVIGDEIQQGRRSTEATLDLAEGVGVVRARGKLFDHRLDRDLYELQPGEPLHPDPDPEPRDPDPEPDPEPGPPAPAPPGKQTDDPRVRALVDQWLASRGLDGWGRKLGAMEGGFVKANYEPDGATGMSRHEWVWIHFWKDGLNAFVQRGLRGGGGSGDVGGR